jgi:hypothetical protein
MASNVKYNCIEQYAKNNSWKFKEYTNECVIWRGTDTTNYFSFNQNGQFKRFKNSAVAFSGTWVCDGDSNFILTTTDGVYYSSDGFKKRDNTSQPTPTTGIDPVFSCLKPFFDADNRKLNPQKGGYVTVYTRDRTAIWVFSKVKSWSQFNVSTKKIDFTGKWECTGTASFSIISGGQQWLSSDKLGWVDIAEPTTEPTTKPPTGGGGFTWKDVNLTIEDLKSGKTVSMGMRGPIVKQIQELLIGKGYKEVSKSGQPDSMFGGMTKAQVENFQTENKNDKGEQLKKDGIVGQETINALLKTPPANTKGVETAVKQYVPKGVSPTLPK